MTTTNNGAALGGRKGKLKALQKQQQWALKSESAKSISAMIELARSEPGIPVSHRALDADPWFLNCCNGTLDLRTGRLRGHRREDLLTKLCHVPYEPDAACDLWVGTLLKSFAGNAALLNYFQRLCGYSLTGDVREQMLPIFWGDGSNGKSLVFSTVMHVLGTDYACVGGRELVTGQNDAHTTYLTDLFGKRLVTLAETREGGRINEALIKQLTGGEKVRARRMREDNWEFDPTHKIWLATNHKPEVRGTDHGIWRRLRLIPFTVKFWDPDKKETGKPELMADKTLPVRLLAEAPGILAWMVRGCLEWQAGGLAEPDEVTVATENYRKEQDVLAAFLADRCQLGPDHECRATELYQAYRDWHQAGGEKEKPMSQRKFGGAMRKRDNIEAKTNNGVWYVGVDLARESPFQR